jgi:GNAT superfamily N-acetyltransferase
MTSAELTRFDRDDAIADIKNDGNWWYFNRIYTPPQYRNKGYGTKVLKQVIAWADKEGQHIYLDRNAYGAETGGLNDAQLEKWYSKYGFVPIPSKRSEYRKSMMRRSHDTRKP